MREGCVMIHWIVGLRLAMALAAPVAASAQGGLTELIRMAEQGDAVAQYNLGFSFGYGTGVSQDDARAVTWYRRAAEQGLAAAQHHRGVMYANGDGVPENEGEALSHCPARVFEETWRLYCGATTETHVSRRAT